MRNNHTDKIYSLCVTNNSCSQHKAVITENYIGVIRVWRRFKFLKCNCLLKNVFNLTAKKSSKTRLQNFVINYIIVFLHFRWTGGSYGIPRDILNIFLWHGFSEIGKLMSNYVHILSGHGILYSHFEGNSLVIWWRHQMETFSALLAPCADNSPVTGKSPHKGQWRGALMFSLISAWING